MGRAPRHAARRCNAAPWSSPSATCVAYVASHSGAPLTHVPIHPLVASHPTEGTLRVRANTTLQTSIGL